MSGAWHGKDMPEMWSSAQAADTQMAWDQVLAWRRTHDLLDFHQSQLRRARQELMAAWPPERSPAAAAFATRIDRTIQVLDEAKVAAAKNQDALAAVLSSLRDTRNDMAVLVEEWEEHQRTPVSAGRSAVIPPSYAVTIKAQERMARNDQEVLAAYRTMVDLPGIDVEYGSEQWRPDPAQPESYPNGETHGSGTGGGSPPLSPPTVQTPEMVDAAYGLTDPGAGLAGSIATTAPPPTGGPSTPSTATESVGSMGFAPASGTAGPGRSPEPVAAFSDTRRVAPGMDATARIDGPTAGRYLGGRWINPVGGVIGAPPEGAVSSHGAQPRGPSPGGGNGAGSGVGTGMPIGGAGGARRSDERGPEPARRLRWEVAQGVPPVIEAPPDIPFELGPGVFGIDRG